MAEASAKTFLGLLERSGIVAPEKLGSALDELEKHADGQPVGLDQLTRHLIDSGIITEWHRDKLTAGKYKGFG